MISDVGWRPRGDKTGPLDHILHSHYCYSGEATSPFGPASPWLLFHFRLDVLDTCNKKRAKKLFRKWSSRTWYKMMAIECDDLKLSTGWFSQQTADSSRKNSHPKEYVTNRRYNSSLFTIKKSNRVCVRSYKKKEEHLKKSVWKNG